MPSVFEVMYLLYLFLMFVMLLILLVQLVPGTEVAVAPKKRRENSSQDVQKQSALKEEAQTKALLRVQAADRKYVHKFKYKGVELGVILSYAVLVHPDTAARASISNLQLVTVSSKSSPKRLAQKGKEVTQKKGILLPKERVREVVVYILFSDSVSKGHVMLPHSIRHYISADIHSCKFKNRSFCVVNLSSSNQLWSMSSVLKASNSPCTSSDLEYKHL